MVRYTLLWPRLVGGLVLTRHGVFGLIVLVLVRGVP